MSISRIAILGAAAVFLAAVPVRAGITVGGTVTVDEYGVGTMAPAAAVAFPLASAITADTGPTGAPNALVYLLPPGTAITVGDVILIDPAGVNPADLIRFNPNSTMVFYSDYNFTYGPISPADIGFPSTLYANQATTNEFTAPPKDHAFYTPLPGQPGFDATGQVNTYHIIAQAPEPASLGLLALSGSMLLRRRKTAV